LIVLKVLDMNGQPKHRYTFVLLLNGPTSMVIGVAQFETCIFIPILIRSATSTIENATNLGRLTAFFK